VAAHFQGGRDILKPLKWYESLHEAKGRQSQQAFLVEGTRAIRQILHSFPQRVIEIIRTASMDTVSDAMVPCRCVTDAQFKGIALSRTPAGPLAVVSMPADINSPLPPENPGEHILALEDIQDPGNIGTLIRSAAAFDFSGIICSDKCADPYSPKAIQASCGAIVSVWLRRTPEFRTTLSALREGGHRIIAADAHGKPWSGEDKAGEKTVFILGNEGNGISAETMGLADEAVQIPINATKVESLNVAATGAILMFLSRLFNGNAGASVPL